MTVSKLSAEAFAALGASSLVYVRPVRAPDIIAAPSAEALDDADLEPGRTLYAVHSADGECLAVLGDRESAVAVALAHELAAVSVH